MQTKGKTGNLPVNDQIPKDNGLAAGVTGEAMTIAEEIVVWWDSNPALPWFFIA